MPNRLSDKKPRAAARASKPAPASPGKAPPRAAAAAKGWAPAARASSVALGAVTARALQAAGPSSFELVPGRYPDAVALPRVLEAMGSSPRGKAAVEGVLAQLQQRTGVAVPKDVRAAALANPGALTRALELSPAQLSAGVVALNAAHKAGKLGDAAPPKRLLPRTFDLSKVDAVDAPRAKPELKELAPGLFQGDLPSAKPDLEVKRNRVLAEVFDRLANNPSLPAAERFTVTHGGKKFSSLEALTRQLQADGYDVQVRFDQRVANFTNLKTPVPGSTPPRYLDVPAPLMLRTGLADKDGKEALVPASHSEMVVSIRGGPKGAPRLDADLKFYQGTSGTGFFPCDEFASPSWCGSVTQARAEGAQALRAISVAGAFTDVVNTTAKAKGLWAGGYGLTGVCNDSVAVVQQAVTGRATQYPLLMRDSLLGEALERRLHDGERAGDADYRAIRAAMGALPSDVKGNPTQRERALASLPWAAGREPFTSSVEARRVLRE